MICASTSPACTGRPAGRVTNLLDLLQGRLSKEILADISAHGTGLFPAPAEIKLECSCPDWADMCKHVAAVLYGVGARLDHDPALFFTLRGVDMQELLTAASEVASGDLTGANAGDTALADADLTEIFGVDIETAAAPPTSLVPTAVPASPGRKSRAAKTAVTSATASKTDLRPLRGGKKTSARPAKRAGHTAARKKSTTKKSAQSRSSR